MTIKIIQLSNLLPLLMIARPLFPVELAHGAPPAVSMNLVISPSNDSVRLRLSPSRSAAGCAYEIFGSSKVRDLERPHMPARRRLARLPATHGVTQLTISSLPRLQGKPREQNTAFFRSRIGCNREFRVSNLKRLSLRASRAGTVGISDWISAFSSRLKERKIRIVQAFQAFQFQSPVAMVTPGDKSSRLFVVEQGGRIISFDNSDDTSTSRVFLDISSRIANGGELGLLGLAFHPSFSSNGKFYINYTESRPEDASKYRSVISVFTLTTPFAETASNANEERLLVIDQPFSNHNGGDLAFGKDGYLYIAMGDGGSGGDPLGHAQNKGSLLGKILRIDVDSKTDTLTYGIPRSNPFWRNKSGYREEIFAYGLRNPFRMSFDRVTGNLWVGDVGQGAREEINIVTAGGNYGWNLREGSLCYPPGSSCKGSNFIRPITEYGRDEGRSVIGGYVYRGKSIPRLAGTYLYADFISGKIFGLVYDGNRAETETLLDTGLLISSFGQDNKKELYLLSYQEGKIYRIVSD